MTNNANTQGNETRIRQCSFDPASHLIDITQTDGSTAKYLLVQDRVLWFHKYCEENGLFGTVDDSNIEFIESIKMFKATCLVIIDGEIVGKSVGSCILKDDTEKAIELAATSAKGRALANAGFGTAMCYQDDSEQIPCDAGVRVPDAKSKNEADDMFMVPDNDEKSFEEPETAKNKSMEVKLPTTLEEAQKIILDLPNYRGKTLGEVAALDFQYLKFLAERYNPRKHPEYKEGAKILLANM